MLSLHSFASSSKGNSHAVICESGIILVDAGISCKRIRQGLESLGKSLDDVLGIVFTHSHIDHVSGFKVLSSECVPYVSRELLSQLKSKCDRKFVYELQQNFDEGFKIGNVFVKPFEVMHDSDPTYGYTFEDEDNKVGVCTDIGMVTPNVESSLMGCSEVILESNYDPFMLETGPYPLDLIFRIKGDLGHLSNEESARLCEKLAKTGTNKIVLAHLSETNNRPELALEEVRKKLKGTNVELSAMFVAEEFRDEKY